jgi:hypothetical protein
MILAIGSLIGAAALYQHRHPCLRYSTHRIFVAELTTYIVVNGGMSIPTTAPAHYEDETVCEKRK